MDKPKIIVVAGPTASGKSAAAVALCRRIGGEVVSADSMQVYRGMDIGTAKASEAEMDGIPHHMLDVADPGVNFSAAMYREMASSAVRGILERGNVPVVCGGTGLYIDALTRPMGFARPGNEAIRQRLMEEAEKPGGKEALHERLRGIDPETAERLSPNDLRRVVRGLEIHELTGKSQTELNRLDAEKETEYDVAMFALEWPREVLYRRIDRRVDDMIRLGLVDEVRGLLDAGLSTGSTAMQALGYKEIAEYLRGEISLEEAVDRVKQGSRHYAKRQISWFRRDARVRWIQAEGKTAEDIAGEIARAAGYGI